MVVPRDGQPHRRKFTLPAPRAKVVGEQSTLPLSNHLAYLGVQWSASIAQGYHGVAPARSRNSV